MQTAKTTNGFSPYQKFIILILAFISFTVVLDFMIMNPLGDILMKKLHLTTSQFGFAVSAYAFSAGTAGILAAGFADKYDRKKFLMFFYVGFLIGTLICGFAETYEVLVCGRIVAGLFGGVLSSISMAIIADLFPIQDRGKVIGYTQMAFAASQILGIPIGIYLAYHLNWHWAFYMIVLVCAVVGMVIVLKMQPVVKHLEVKNENNPFVHLRNTLVQKEYIIAFCATALLFIGGFLMMPFGNTFIINNIKISSDDLPLIFIITGVCSVVIMPLVAKLCEKFGRFPMFVAGSALAATTVLIYTNLGETPLWIIILINAFMFAGIMSRIIPSQTLMTALPQMHDRGAFMAINASLQQMAGGIASLIAGFVVYQKTEHLPLENYDLLGYVCVGVMVVCGFFVYAINKRVNEKTRDESENKTT